MLRTVLLWCLSAAASLGQTLPVTDPAPFVRVRSVSLHGNHRTRDAIILREMSVRAGDTLRRNELQEKLNWDRRRIANTNLFITVDLVTKEVDSLSIDLEVHLKERWYLFAVPTFYLADRNFNEWWYERNRDLRRTIYGIRVRYKNVTGRADRLAATFETGFVNRADLSYALPYVDRNQKTGLGFGFSYLTNKEIAYRSAFDKLLFLKDENLLRERFQTNVVLTRRNQFFAFHQLELRYARMWVADTIARLNPDYLLDARTRQRYLQLGYTYTFDRRDDVAYPLRGHFLTLTANQYGLLPTDDVRLTELLVNYNRYWPLTGKFYLNAMTGAKLSWPDRQPYTLFRGLGYQQNFVRGYDLYVIDGERYFLTKNTLRYQLLNVRKQFKWIPVRQFSTVPLALYLDLFADAGYVHSGMAAQYESRLANTWLFGTGLGLDVVTFYNTVLRFTYAINRQGQTGFFFNYVYDL